MIDPRAWPGPAVVGPVAGGHRSEVVEIRGDGRLVARRSRRPPEASAGELDLMDLLAARRPVRVDHADLDLAEVPGALTGERLRIATAATDAWEAANGWLVESEYARGRLARSAAGPTAR